MYKLSNLAAEDFAGIYSYTLGEFGVDQADAYTSSLEHCLLLLSDQPAMGRDYSHIKSDIFRFDHDKHAVFYKRTAEGIYVLRILHQQMDLLRHL